MRNTERSIIVGYDGSPEADVALAWAAATARLEGLAVRAVIVDDVSASPWSAHDRERDREHGEQVEKVLAQAGVEGVADRASGSAAPVLIRAAEDAPMLVVGSRGRGRAGEMFLGSVSQHVARHASCPVVVVRAAPRSASGRIVVGIDGSGESAAALEFACRRAERTGETVLALHGWRSGRVDLDYHGELPHDLGDKQAAAELLLGEAVAGVRAAHPDVVLEQEAIPVHPRDLLVDASARASLVVTGSRGRGAFTGLLLGSVSHDVLHRATCPVAVVR